MFQTSSADGHCAHPCRSPYSPSAYTSCPSQNLFCGFRNFLTDASCLYDRANRRSVPTRLLPGHTQTPPEKSVRSKVSRRKRTKKVHISNGKITLEKLVEKLISALLGEISDNRVLCFIYSYLWGLRPTILTARHGLCFSAIRSCALNGMYGAIWSVAPGLTEQNWHSLSTSFSWHRATGYTSARPSSAFHSACP